MPRFTGCGNASRSIAFEISLAHAKVQRIDGIQTQARVAKECMQLGIRQAGCGHLILEHRTSLEWNSTRGRGSRAENRLQNCRGIKDLSGESAASNVVACHMSNVTGHVTQVLKRYRYFLEKTKCMGKLATFFHGRGSHAQTSLINSKHIVVLIKTSSTGFQ